MINDRFDWRERCALALLSLAAAPACTRDLCSGQVSATGRYRVTIVELYDAATSFQSTTPPSSSMPCEGASGIRAGDVFEVAGTGELGGRGCLSVVADFASVPSSLTVLGPPTTMPAQERWRNASVGFLAAAARVTAPGGDGDLVLELAAGPTSKDVFATPVVGQLPPTIASGTLYTAPPGTRCYDQYVVKLEKQ